MLRVPGAVAAGVTVTRTGPTVAVTAGGTRRLVTLPAVLQRCSLASATVRAGELLLDFVPDPALWPTGEGEA